MAGRGAACSVDPRDNPLQILRDSAIPDAHSDCMSRRLANRGISPCFGSTLRKTVMRMARVSYIDLRGFIDEVDRLGALRRIDGADPYLEIGGVTEVAAGLPDCPALLFDRIKGFSSGFRIFTNATTNLQRACLALGIDPTLRPLEALKAWMEIRRDLQLHTPVEIQHADFLENSDVHDAVDLSKFPVPHWHQQDGGPYIGSGSLVIMRDPDRDWVNASIYRV